MAATAENKNYNARTMLSDEPAPSTRKAYERCAGASSGLHRVNLRLSLLICVLVAIAQPAAFAADLDQKIEFNIPAQDLGSALIQFSQQTRLQVIVSDDIRGQTTQGIVGRHAIKQALTQLLSPAGLRYQVASDTSVTVSKAPETTWLNAPTTDPVRMALANQNTPDASDAGTTQAGAETGASTANQDDAASSDSEAATRGIPEVVVTGTHIKGVGNSTAPVISLDHETIVRTGYSTTEDLLESLPQNFGGGQAGASADGVFGNGAFRLLNFSAGTGVNLRGIGASSTLVLVNGHRVAPAALGTFVDISAIPLSAVERVEIIPDGSSAIYGSDAVAGVVNIILTSDYSGAEAGARYGSASGGTREEKTLLGSFGTSWSGGGGVISVQRQDLDALLSRERSFSSGLRQPSTLLPETVNSSVFVNVGQELGKRARLGLDLLYSLRDVWAQESVSFTPAVDSSDVEQQGYSIAPTLQLALSDGWSLDINPLYSKQRLDKELVRRFQAGAVDTSRDVSAFELSSVDVVSSFDVAKLPAGELSAAVGAAYRDEQFEDDFQGLGGFDAQLAVSRNVTSAFAEFHVPLAAALEMSAAVRWDSYSDFGDTTNPRVGILWKLGDSLRLRGSYSHSFRAPTVIELNNTTQGTVGIVALDFARPDGTPGNVPAFFLSGSRTDLEPERAKTTSVGFDFSPEFARGLQLSATYYRIDYTNRILTPPFSRTVLTRPEIYGGLISTFSSDAEAQAFRDAVVATGASYFDATFGQTGIVGVRHVYDMRQQNAARLEQDGYDLTAAYRVELGSVGLSLRANATNVQHILATYRGASQDVDQVATYGNPPKIRVRADVGLDTPVWSINAGVNSYDDYTNTMLTVNEPVDSWLTVDLSARLDLGAWLTTPATDGLTLQFSAQNVFDEDPPFVNLGVPNTVRYDSANANPLGRFLALEVRKQW